MIRALDIVNEKMNDVDEAENKALDEVRDYYNTCMEVLRLRMNGLGRLVIVSTSPLCCVDVVALLFSLIDFTVGHSF